MDLLLEVKRICEKNDIKFCLIAGSLLGSIRHNGFIPWDDDIDIGMIRKEYDKFVQCCKSQLDEAYAFYQCFEDNSPLAFGKLRIKGTHYREEIVENIESEDGVFIDIFPFDNVPNSKIKRKVQAFQLLIIKKILLLRCGYDIKNSGTTKTVLYAVLEWLSYVHSISYWATYCEALMRRYSSESCEYVTAMGGSYSYKKEMQPISVFLELEEHLFEGVAMPVPKKYDVFLGNLYGDYMQLPPVEKRIGKHKVAVIDLGDYIIRH